MIGIMDHQIEQFRAYISRVTVATGLKPSEIAARAGVAASTITRPVYRPEIASAPTLRTITKIVQAVGIPFEVDGRLITPTTPAVEGVAPSPVSQPLAFAQLPFDPAALPYDLPVYLLSAYLRPHNENINVLEGYTMQDQSAEFCRRPPGVSGVPNAYATYAPDDALYKYDSGDLLIVAPDRPARAGDHVLVTVVAAPGGCPVTYLGRLLGRDRDWLTLGVDRPTPMQQQFTAPTVQSVHKVLTMREIVGL